MENTTRKKDDSFESLLASIRGALYHQQVRRQQLDHAAPPRPFVTISRQGGAGGRTLARLLAGQLNTLASHPDEWTVWDKELVEKVAREGHIPPDLVRSLEDGAFAGPSQPPGPTPAGEGAPADEWHVYRRVVATLRALSRAGHVILVGRGGVYATRDLKGGVHVRLVAPLDVRVARQAELLHVSPEQARVEVERLDRQREEFHRHYWATRALLPENFTITLNTADLTDAEMVACLLPLVEPLAAAPRRGEGTTPVGAR